jgi:thiamine biosynthesis lipoprotein
MSSTPSSDVVDRAFELMGTHIRILVGEPSSPEAGSPEDAADRVEAFLGVYNETMSRFRPDSELTKLNADEREEIPASPLMCSAIAAALAAAEQSEGLVDPTLLDELEVAGYRDHWTADNRVELSEALAANRPAVSAANVAPASRWREISVDAEAGLVRRPRGVRIDTGGTGKGHAADLAGELLSGFETWAVDCGGDVKIGGNSGVERQVQVVGAFQDAPIETMTVRGGAVATSGMNSRIWRDGNGNSAHHLLNPATGQPAFTGLVAATAAAPTAVEAETLAKVALLKGPEAATSVLSRFGGITVDEQGKVERIGQLAAAPRVQIKMPSRDSSKANR